LIERGHSPNVLLEEIAFAATAMARADNWRDGIDALLERLGRSVNVSRVYLFELGQTDQGTLTHTCRHDWAAPGLDRQAGSARYTHEIIENYDPEFDSWIARRRRGETIRGHTRELTGVLREDFDFQQIKSFMSTPVHVDGVWWGHLGFDDCVEERNWVVDEVHLLQTTAVLIGASVAREGAARKLREDSALREAMIDVSLDGIIIIDAHGLVREFNPAAEAMFGRLRENMVGLPMAEALVPQGLRAAHEAGFRAATKQRRLSGPGTRAEMFGLRSNGTEFPLELSIVQIDRGQEILYAGFVRDLTDRRAAEERMRVAERDKASLARYFSPQLVERLIAIDKPLSVDHHQRASVLFVDMIGFTGFCAANSPATVIAVLRELLAILSRQVFAHHGTIDKFLGDGLMAVFGSPVSGLQDATNGVNCGLDLLRAVERWNADCGRTADAIKIAVGIHTGHVILGDIGSEQRLEFAVLGDTVNIASRVEGKCRSLDMAMLVTSEVMDAVAAEAAGTQATSFIDLGLQTLRGRETPVKLFGIPRNAFNSFGSDDATPSALSVARNV
jgi:PAS domain S-box-containing protein